MKKNMMLVGLMMMSTIIFAQHQRKADPAAMAAKRSEKMKTELSLSDDQYAKVKAINEKFANSYSTLRKDTSLTIGTSRKRMEKLRTDQQTQIKSVLTEAQLAKWTALKAKKEEERKNHKHKGDKDKGDKHKKDNKG